MRRPVGRTSEIYTYRPTIQPRTTELSIHFSICKHNKLPQTKTQYHKSIQPVGRSTQEQTHPRHSKGWSESQIQISHVHYFLVKQWLTLTVSLWMRHTSKQRITTVVFGTRQIDRFDQENSEYNECENPLQSNNLDRELLDGQCCSNQPVHL